MPRPGLGGEQPDEVVVAQERREVEVVRRPVAPRERQLVVLAALDGRPVPTSRPQPIGNVALGGVPRRSPVAGLDPYTSTVVPGAPTFDGNRLASPEMVTRPGFSGTTSVVAGADPVKNR